MSDADDHFQNAARILDVARFEGKLEMYLTAGCEFDFAAAAATLDAQNSSSEWERDILFAFALNCTYEAQRARGMYWYERHEVEQAKAYFAVAAVECNRAIQMLEKTIVYASDPDCRVELWRRIERTKLCRNIDAQWMDICNARSAFDADDWTTCVDSYRRVLSACKVLIPACYNLGDAKLTSVLEGNHFTTLVNCCQATVGSQQSVAAVVEGGHQLTMDQASTITRSWLDAYRYAVNAITANPGVQQFYAGLLHIRAQLEKVAADLPLDFLLQEFGDEYDLISLLRTANPNVMQDVILQGRVAVDATACRVLFLAANPSEIAPLKIELEAGEILYAIRREGDRLIDISFRWSSKPTELQQNILEFRPDILHFSGHGTRCGGIAMEDFCGRPFLVSGEGLSALFRCFAGEIRVVLLNACHSATQANGIAEHVDCVIGMNDSVGDWEARRFAVAFYRAISHGRTVYQAFELGRSELLLQATGQENLPVLVARSGIDPKKIVLRRTSSSTTQSGSG